MGRSATVHRVLIVSSMYLPYMAADMHRARLLSAELPRMGWDVELLVPGDKFQRAEHFEPRGDLFKTDQPVHRVKPEWTRLFRLARSGSLGWRALRPLHREGARLLTERRFDLVYISCAQFPFFYLARLWRSRFDVPVVLDFHDPWYSPPTRSDHRPGGWKRDVGNRIAKYMEAATLRSTSGVVSVSPNYLEELNRRYAGRRWASLRKERQAVIPFAASESDLEATKSCGSLPERNVEGPKRTIVYTGAGGTIMRNSFRKICRMLRRLKTRNPNFLQNLCFKLVGTEPLVDPGSTPVLSAVAREFGLQDLVQEFPSRVSYLQAVQLITQSDGLIILGVDDQAYVPSKLGLYALTGKPLLACMRAGSVIGTYFRRNPDVGHLLQFEPTSESETAGEDEHLSTFIHEVVKRRRFVRNNALQDWLAPAMAQRHAQLFELCMRDERDGHS